MNSMASLVFIMYFCCVWLFAWAELDDDRDL